LIRELKQRRSEKAGQSSESIKADLQLEEAKQKGKFKPIGFTSTSKRRKVDGAGTADGKKKKRKVDNNKKDSDSQVKPLAASKTDTSPTKTTPEPPKPTAADDFDDNFDIFAGAGEYTGVEIDDNDEAEIPPPHLTEVPSSLPQRWIAMDEPEHVPQASYLLNYPSPSLKLPKLKQIRKLKNGPCDLPLLRPLLFHR
jgi:IK cytokine